jgi:hypothetical protein
MECSSQGLVSFVSHQLAGSVRCIIREIMVMSEREHCQRGPIISADLLVDVVEVDFDCPFGKRQSRAAHLPFFGGCY